MTKVLFLTNEKPTDLEVLIEERLSASYDLTRVYVEPGYLWMESIKDAIHASEVIILPIVDIHTKSENKRQEINYVISYARASNDKLILPLVFGNIKSPIEVRDFLHISVEPQEPDTLERTVQTIKNAISTFKGRRDAKEALSHRRFEKIEKKASIYVEETITELKKREEKLINSARVWYRLGYGALLLGAMAAAWLAYQGVGNSETIKPNWEVLLFLGVKSLILLALLIALSKYSFNLAKAYMDESLKNADRIHAISFGKFFLQAFGEDANAENIKEIFQHWNTKGSNSFSSANSDFIDPKILKLASNLANAMHASSTKKGVKP